MASRKKNPAQSQDVMFGHAQQRAFDKDKTFLHLVEGGLTREELAALIKKRPAVYGGYKNWLSKLPSSEVKQIHFWVVRMDETQYWNRDKLKKDFGKFSPTKIWSVFLVAPEQHVHIASMTPSCRADFLYHTFEVPSDTPEDVLEAIEDVGLQNPDEDTYYDTRDIERIISSKTNARDWGLYDSEEEEDKDAWEKAREDAQGNPPF